MATFNTARVYGLRDRGAVAPGYLADLVVLDDLSNFTICEVYKSGVPLEELPKAFPHNAGGPPSDTERQYPFAAGELLQNESRVQAFPVIGIVPGQLATEKLMLPLPGEERLFRSGGRYLENCRRSAA